MYYSYEKWISFLLFNAIFQVEGSELYNRHLQKVLHATVGEYSVQLTNDNSDDKSINHQARGLIPWIKDVLMTFTLSYLVMIKLTLLLWGLHPEERKVKVRKRWTLICQIHWYQKRSDPLAWLKVNKDRLPQLS